MQPSAPDVAEINLDSVKIEPKTPGVLEIFSPASTQPSEARPEGRSGTPPPIGLGAGTATDAAGEGRGSRRARAQVSYAEPSLVSKMRRPGKEMAPAVSTGRRSTSAQPEVERTESEGYWRMNYFHAFWIILMLISPTNAMLLTLSSWASLVVVGPILYIDGLVEPHYAIIA